MKKIHIIRLLASIVLIAYTISCSWGSDAPTITEDYQTIDSTFIDTLVVPKEDSISIVAVGDIMMGTNYPTTKTLPPKDGKTLFKGVQQYLAPFDLTFGNLEGVIGRGGVPKSCNQPKYCYTFRMPSHYTNHLKNAGFDFVSIANNHANDFGAGGRKASAAVLDTSGLFYAGSIDKPYTIFEKDSIKYGFLAAAPNSGCFSMKNYKEAAKIVRRLDSLCDIVIVSFHAGAEGASAIHTPRKDEVFLGYNRGNVYKFAHDCIDAGADILLGHGPHVTRAVELYKERFIAYSMGNFCTYEKFSLKGPKGVGPIIQLQVNKEGKFLAGKVIPTKQLGEGIPVYDEEKQALQQLIDLSLEDFKESPLVIHPETGNMTYQPPNSTTVDSTSSPNPDSTQQNNKEK
ncbi:CapA family protein [Aureispira anguillae]|uniref:CapA family protein n=1 Tax=Aureispira anguillae TaxID=2864201 RepID=A0A916DVJ1_9BACT|nr:CapA family protein [Aureispira anguillae]BDS13782.1 CapA family protein [Aureispira anguillae]